MGLPAQLAEKLDETEVWQNVKAIAVTLALSFKAAGSDLQRWGIDCSILALA